MQFAEMFLQMVASESNGAISAKEGKKQWVFYFKAGKLVQTKSNIKSEQGGALRERLEDTSLENLIREQTLVRMKKACGKMVALTQTNAQASKALPIKSQDLFVEVFGTLLREDELLQACNDLQDAKVEKANSMNFQDPQINALLGSFDGLLTTKTIVHKNPLDTRKAWAALWYAHQTGQLQMVEQEEAEELFDFDLDDILEQEATVSPTQSAEPQEPQEEAFDIEIDEEPAKPQRHSMADKLERLEERINHAENHFEIFALPWDSPVDEFRKAFRDLSLNLHPDRYVDAPEEMQETATELFSKAREAWEVLENDEKRKKYIDNKIHGIKSEEDEAMEQLQAYWNAEENFKRGLALFNQGRLGPAHENFQKAVDICPEELEFRAYYGYTSFATQRSSNMEKAYEGIGILKEVIEQNQEQEKKLDMAWMLIGRAYREAGEEEKAVRTLKQALKYNPSNDQALRELRRIKGKKKPNAKDKGKTEKKKGFFSGLFGKKK